jgi:hypothetical protein
MTETFGSIVFAGACTAHTRVRTPMIWMWSPPCEWLDLTQSNLRMGAANQRSSLSRHTQETKE